MAGCFTLDCNEIFIRCFDMKSLWTYKLDGLDSGAIEAKSWTRVSILNTYEESYPVELKLFSKVITGNELRELARYLCISRLIINRDGLCFLDVAGITDSSHSIAFYRLNDLFDWSKYGVEKQVITTIWARCCIEKGTPIIDYSKQIHEKDVMIESLQEKLASAEHMLKSTNELLENKEKEWEKRLQLKNEELKCVRSQLEEAMTGVERVTLENANLMKKLDGLDGYALGMFSGRGSVTVLDYADILICRRIMWPEEKFEVRQVPNPKNPFSLPPKGHVPRVIKPLPFLNHVRELPRLAKIGIEVSDGHFDTSNWWIVTTDWSTDIPIISLLFYGGAFDYGEAFGVPVPIPYHQGAVLAGFYSFEVVMIRGIGNRFTTFYKRPRGSDIK